MNILYLTKTLPLREYTISKKLLELDPKIEKIFACVFSKRNYADLLIEQNQTRVFDEVFDFVEFSKKELINNSDIDCNLLEYERKYSLSLNLAITGDRYLSILSEYEAKKRILVIVKYFDYIINKYGINKVIGELSSASDYICYKLCVYYNIQYIFFWHGRMKNKMEFTDLDGNRSDLANIYTELLKRRLSEDDIKLYNNYINEMLQNIEPDYMRYTKKDSLKSIWQRRNIEPPLARLRKYFATYSEDKKYSADMPPNIKYKFKNIFIKVLFPIKRRIFDFYYDNVNLVDKFYLVPLHYQPESSTLVFAPYYLNQIEHIINLSKAIPAGTYLYVKEHPAMVMNREISFYKRLKKVKNVRIINANYPTQKLIQGSIGVITLTNTTGYEAILLDIPVFVFGNVFYNTYNYAYRCNNYVDFGKYVHKSLKEWDKLKQERSEDRMTFIIANLKSLKVGNMNSPLYDNSFFDDVNICNICENIIESLY